MTFVQFLASLIIQFPIQLLARSIGWPWWGGILASAAVAYGVFLMSEGR